MVSFIQVSPPKPCMNQCSPPYMPRPSPSSWLDQPNSVCWAVQIIQFLTMYSSPLPCYPVPLRPIYSPQHPIFKHPQPTFLPQCKRPGFTPGQHNRQNCPYWRQFLHLQSEDVPCHGGSTHLSWSFNDGLLNAICDVRVCALFENVFVWLTKTVSCSQSWNENNNRKFNAATQAENPNKILRKFWKTFCNIWCFVKYLLLTYLRTVRSKLKDAGL